MDEPKTPYRTIAEKVLSSYRKSDAVVGIIWIGSSALGIEDSFTDIDLRVLSRNVQKSEELKQEVEGVTVKIEEMSWAWITQKADLTSEQYWIREKAVILYDPDQMVKKTFQALNDESKKKFDSVLWRLYKKVFSLYDIKKCIERKEHVAANMFVYKTIDAFTQFMFIYHRQAVPTFKWRWYFLKKDQLFDVDKLEKIFSAKKGIEEQCSAVEELQQTAQTMMLAKGYEKEKVSEPWRF